MPRKRKSGLECWMENCFRCKHMTRTHYLHGGVDEGAVKLECTLNGNAVEPWHMDGCKKFEVGIPTETTEQKPKKDRE